MFEFMCACALMGAVEAAAGVQDPPFPDGTELTGSMVFDEDNWDVTVVGQPGASYVRMTEAGIRVQPQGDPTRAVLQHKIEFTPTDGVVTWASFRIRFDHGDEMPAFFGFFSTDTNPFSGLPDVMACFKTIPLEMPDGEHAQLFAVTKSSGEDPNEDYLIDSVGKVESWDFVIKVDGTDLVTFWYRESDGPWSLGHEIGEDLPNGSLRFSFAQTNPGTLGFSVLRIFEFEADD